MTFITRKTRVTRLALKAFALLVCVLCPETGAQRVSGSGTWVVKPPAGVAVDGSSPLAVGLVGVWHLDQNPLPVNLVNAASSGGYQGAPTLSPTEDGIGMSALTDADYLRVTDPSNVLNLTTGPLSIEVDFYYGAPAPGRVLVGRDHFLVNGFDIQTANDGAGKRIVTEINHNGTADIISTGPVLKVGAMNRVLVTYSGSTAVIYVNGVNAASGAYTAPVLAAEDLFVGRDATFGGLNFNNPITRLVMWQRELTASEALQVTKNDPYAYMAAPLVIQPEISGLAVDSMTSTSVAINWTTNIPSDSLVQYGPTSAYGSSSALDSTPATAHTQALTGLAVGALYHYQVVSKDATGAIVASPDSTFTPLNGLEFVDDFNGAALDTISWASADRSGNGGAGELQYYRPPNIAVDGGFLRISGGVDSSMPGYNYTAGLVQWPTFSFLYGTAEIRAKLTGGSGPRPAFRLLGTDCQDTNLVVAGNSPPCSWPQQGSDEITVAEVLNNNVFFVNQQIHSGPNAGGCFPFASDVSQDWHTYAVVWSPGLVEWKIDGTSTCTVATGVPSTPMFLSMNVAIGGTIDDATLPQSMAVDYVRVYQQTDITPPTVTTVNPAGGATDIATTSAVAVTFSEPMAPATIGGTTVMLTGPGATPIPATVTYSAATHVATLTPIGSLTNLTTYSALVKGGSGGVTDPAGNPLATDVTWIFTTAADTTAPTISALNAVPTSVSAVITWTTDEPSTSRVDFGTSAAALMLTAGNATLTTVHAVTLTGLSPGIAYYFRVMSADAASNAATSPALSNAPASFSTTMPTGGLVAAYSFNEGAGTTVSDASGMGNIGTIAGATWTSGGRFGNALSFDGASNWVTVNNAPALGLTTAMTLEAWVNPASLSGWETILYKERPDPDAGLAWALYSTDSTAPPAVYAAMPASPWTHVTGSSFLTLNAWAHVAGTYDGTALKLYVNGVMVRSKALTGAMPVSTGPLRIGGNAISLPYGGQYFKGLIDEIRIYNRALTRAEIQADMNAPLPRAISAMKVATTPNTAVITWTTSVPSTSRVDYGTSSQALTSSAGSVTLTTAHTVALSELSIATTYYFRVTSVDSASNTSTAPATNTSAASFVTVNANGLVAAYSFNEGLGGTVADSSGMGNAGSIAGASWTTEGRYGNALSFDGSSNWVTVNDAPSLGLTTAMTLEAWVKPASLTGWQTVIYKERAGVVGPPVQDPGLAWALYSSDSTSPPALYGMAANATGASQWTHVTGPSMLPLNVWTHVAGTYNGTTLRLYINGVLVKSSTVLNGNLAVSNGALRIGGNVISLPYGGQYFKGLIDEVRIYNRALTQSEIHTDMIGPLP